MSGFECVLGPLPLHLVAPSLAILMLMREQINCSTDVRLMMGNAARCVYTVCILYAYIASVKGCQLRWFWLVCKMIGNSGTLFVAPFPSECQIWIKQRCWSIKVAGSITRGERKARSKRRRCASPRYVIREPHLHTYSLSLSLPLFHVPPSCPFITYYKDNAGENNVEKRKQQRSRQQKWRSRCY